MTTLVVRNVDPSLKERLRMRAARNGQSMGAELSRILSDALDREPDPGPNLAEAIRRRFEPFGGVELEPHPPVAIPDPPGVG